MRSLSRAVASFVLATSIVLLTACAGPTTSSQDYKRKAAATAKAAASEVATASVGTDLAVRARATASYLDVTFSNAEDGLSSEQENFSSRQPPTPADDKTRDQLNNLLSAALDAVANSRIAARRGDVEALRAGQPALRKSAKDLQRFEEAVS
jgi:hypothetical protein